MLINFEKACLAASLNKLNLEKVTAAALAKALKTAVECNNDGLSSSLRTKLIFKCMTVRIYIKKKKKKHHTEPTS